MPELIQLAYASRAVRRMTLPALTELLGEARVINAGRELTGMLLYRDRAFLQVLEGRSADVHLVYARIRRDPRHDRVRTLYERAIPRRDFPDWRMGFRSLDDLDLGDLPGFSDFMDRPGSAQQLFDDLTTAKKLLLLFRTRPDE